MGYYQIQRHLRCSPYTMEHGADATERDTIMNCHIVWFGPFSIFGSLLQIKSVSTKWIVRTNSGIEVCECTVRLTE